MSLWSQSKPECVVTLILSSTVCLVYEVSLATHRAHASSLIVATAYVRFIRSTERMTTARPDQVGNSGPNGMDEPPFPPAGEPIPDEAEAVARDAVRPQDQDQLRGERHPPQQLSSRGCGQLTQRDQPSTSQELNRGRSADARCRILLFPRIPLGSYTEPTPTPTSTAGSARKGEHRSRRYSRAHLLYCGNWCSDT